MTTRFSPVHGVAALLDEDNINTDQVLPSTFMRGVEPDYAVGLFGLWRRDSDFVLNREGWQSTKILVAGANFGCGSTREQACWALSAFGIRVLIADSYGEVFRDNCVKNGILPISAPAKEAERLRALLRTAPGPVQLLVDLAAQGVSGPSFAMNFDLAAADKLALLNGLDEIGMTLQQVAAINAWEQQEREARPWRQTLQLRK